MVRLLRDAEGQYREEDVLDEVRDPHRPMPSRCAPEQQAPRPHGAICLQAPRVEHVREATYHLPAHGAELPHELPAHQHAEVARVQPAVPSQRNFHVLVMESKAADVLRNIDVPLSKGLGDRPPRKHYRGLAKDIVNSGLPGPRSMSLEKRDYAIVLVTIHCTSECNMDTDTNCHY